MDTDHAPARVPIRQLVLYFLRLGLLGFGGPVALVGQMERELVADRKWVTRDEMREGIAVCQSLPGPLAIQVGIWLSYIRGGFWGAWAGGWAFILPNFVIVAALAALYVHFGGLSAVSRLTKLGMKDAVEWVLAAAAFVITVAVQAEVALVFVACGIVGLAYYGSLFRARSTASTSALLLAVPLVVTAPQVSLAKLLTFFLKAGSLTFGSGLVIVPFLVVITATFVAAAIGTILGACVLLGKIAIGDWLTVLVALASLAVLFRWKVSNPLLILGAAIVGLVAFPLLRPEWVFVK